MKNLKMIAAFVALSMAFSCQNETTENLELENSKVSKKLTYKERLEIFKTEHSIKTSDNDESLQLRRGLPHCSSYYYNNDSNFYTTGGIRFDFNEPGISNADMAEFYSINNEPFMELIVDFTYEAFEGPSNSFIKKQLKNAETNHGFLMFNDDGYVNNASDALSVLKYDRTNVPVITLVDGLVGGTSLIEYNTADCEKRILVDRNWAYNYSVNQEYVSPTDAFKFILAYSNIKDSFKIPYLQDGDFAATTDFDGVEIYLVTQRNKVIIYDTFYWWF